VVVVTGAGSGGGGGGGLVWARQTTAEAEAADERRTGGEGRRQRVEGARLESVLSCAGCG
jgi:hypothetical protein